MSVPVLGSFRVENLLPPPPEPGERCALCHRRRNKPRQSDSPSVKEVRFRGPADLVDTVEDNLDILQEYTGVDPYSYPRLRLADALIALGARHREELKAHFEGTL